jgi:hypothetical protein
MPKRIVHVIGSGTIGEPLSGLLADFQSAVAWLLEPEDYQKQIQRLSPYLFGEV